MTENESITAEETNSVEGPPELSPTQQAEIEEIVVNWDMNEQDAQTLRSLTRLLVGGALVSWEELREHLMRWEVEATQADETQDPRQEGAIIGSDQPETDSEILRYALIGAFFESQDRWIRRSQSAVNFAGQVSKALLNPVFKRVENEPRLRPIQTRYEALARRGEAVTQRWVNRGRFEENHGRRLARLAAQRSFDTSMDQLGNAPALEDLVRKQSAGLGQTAIDEVRASTVSGDQVAEKVVRTIFRRKPREELNQEPVVVDQTD
jgi:hypothetical protein